ncbi:MAG: hypothetical protein K0S44_2752 [Bacteroidetes bacterium]|jgi:hypothetical protein|nr:hypothetical protein [Bacteroidota bacterium]
MTKTHKLILVSCILSCGAITLKAQKGSVAAGGDATGSGGSVSYSIGQVDHITASGSGGTITQGLQQPYEIFIITGIDAKEINLSASVYPNPTAEQVTLSVKDISTNGMRYVLSDVQGKLIKQDKLTGTETTISMVELTKATYLISVFNNNKEVKIFKIIKN